MERIVEGVINNEALTREDIRVFLYLFTKSNTELEVATTVQNVSNGTRLFSIEVIESLNNLVEDGHLTRVKGGKGIIKYKLNKGANYVNNIKSGRV
jgi:hypothetical protein